MYIDPWNSEIYFSFGDRTDNKGNNYDLVYAKIKKNTANTTIKGTALTIGNPIGKSGEIKTYMYKGVKTPLFGTESSDGGIHISLDFNGSVRDMRHVAYNRHFKG